jgi:putative toxin-antitoxin system antitoxin component (TIGR02293 family)
MLEDAMKTGKTKRRRARATEVESSSTTRTFMYSWTDEDFTLLDPRIFEPATAGIRATRGATIGAHFEDVSAIMNHLKEGFPIGAFERLCRALNISPARLAESLSIAPRTLVRRKKEGRLQFAESERVFRFATLFEKAIAALGDAETARVWFTAPLKALCGKTPLEYAGTEIGAREVEDVLGRMEHGVFA